jgi:hypothetical protein
VPVPTPDGSRRSLYLSCPGFCTSSPGQFEVTGSARVEVVTAQPSSRDDDRAMTSRADDIGMAPNGRRGVAAVSAATAGRRGTPEGGIRSRSR